MISIIIPAYNGESTIYRAIESVAKQRVNKELIVIDDFCTDSTINIVEDFSKGCDFNIRIYRTQKQSCAPNIARNLGVGLAEGEYIAFLDQDDWWEPTKLQEQLEAIYLNNADLCSTSFYAHNEIFGTKRLHGNDTGRIVVVQDMFERFIKRDKSKLTLISTFLFKRGIYPQMDEYFGLTDYLWTAKLLEGNTCVVIEKPLTNRGVSGFNTSFNKFIREITMYEQLMAMVYYAHKYNLDLDHAKKTTFGSYARYCYLQGEIKEARRNFLHAPKDIKVLMYYITSFFPFMVKWVRKKFNVWGDN